MGKITFSKVRSCFLRDCSLRIGKKGKKWYLQWEFFRSPSYLEKSLLNIFKWYFGGTFTDGYRVLRMGTENSNKHSFPRSVSAGGFAAIRLHYITLPQYNVPGNSNEYINCQCYAKDNTLAFEFGQCDQ